MEKSYILMADVIKSRREEGSALAKKLRKLTGVVNTADKKDISSPLTVTLGDEFQGIVKSIHSGIKIIVHLEELIIEKEAGFKLRYVLAGGKIDTPINKKIAHGMLGEGLTKTRELLQNLKKSEERFFFYVNNNLLNKYFILYQSIVDDWHTKDLKLVSDFLKMDDYKMVADKNKKNWSQMWKRKKSLKIKEYNTIRQLIIDQR